MVRRGTKRPLRRGTKRQSFGTLGSPFADRVVCSDYPSRVLHGTTRASARAFKAGVEPERVQKTINEWGDQLLASERDMPQQALMFGEHGGRGFGGRTLLEFKLRCGARVMDVSDEMHRTHSLGIGDRAPVNFRGRPSFTDDMGRWLHEKRVASGAETERARGLTWATAVVDPTSSEFSGTEYLPMLAHYAKDRGYEAVRLADEVVLLDPKKTIEKVRVVPKRERDELKRQPPRCGRAFGKLFVETFDCPPTSDKGR